MSIHDVLITFRMTLLGGAWVIEDKGQWLVDNFFVIKPRMVFRLKSYGNREFRLKSLSG